MSKNTANEVIKHLRQMVLADDKLATGQTAAISTKIVAITQGVLASMLLTKIKTAAVVSLLCVLGLGLGAQFLVGQTQEAKSPPLIGQKAEGDGTAAKAEPALPGLFVVTLEIVDLMPQRGADGKIGPGKKEFDEKDLTGLPSIIPRPAKTPAKKGGDEAARDLRTALNNLLAQGLVLGHRRIQFTAIANQQVEFTNIENKRLLLGAYPLPDGRVQTTSGPRLLGTMAKATVQLADEISITMNLQFNESRLYPPDIGLIGDGKGKGSYIYGVRPTVDVGNPVVKDEKRGAEYQVYDVVSHKLDATLKVPLGKTIVAPGIRAIIASRVVRPSAANPGANVAVPTSTPCEAQIMLIVNVQNLNPGGKAGK